MALDALAARRSYRVMSQENPPPPKFPGRSATDSRRQREAEALRENLRKRKEQQRAREASGVDEPRESPAGKT
jgi:hypothetical protein